MALGHLLSLTDPLSRCLLQPQMGILSSSLVTGIHETIRLVPVLVSRLKWKCNYIIQSIMCFFFDFRL